MSLYRYSEAVTILPRIGNIYLFYPAHSPDSQVGARNILAQLEDFGSLPASYFQRLGEAGLSFSWPVGRAKEESHPFQAQYFGLVEALSGLFDEILCLPEQMRRLLHLPTTEQCFGLKSEAYGKGTAVSDGLASLNAPRHAFQSSFWLFILNLG